MPAKPRADREPEEKESLTSIIDAYRGDSGERITGTLAVAGFATFGLGVFSRFLLPFDGITGVEKEIFCAANYMLAIGSGALLAANEAYHMTKAYFEARLDHLENGHYTMLERKTMSSPPGSQ